VADYVYDSKGNRFLDRIGGLSCVNVGYGRKETAEAMAQQAEKMVGYSDELVREGVRFGECFNTGAWTSEWPGMAMSPGSGVSVAGQSGHDLCGRCRITVHAGQAPSPSGVMEPAPDSSPRGTGGHRGLPEAPYNDGNTEFNLYHRKATERELHMNIKTIRLLACLLAVPLYALCPGESPALEINTHSHVKCISEENSVQAKMLETDDESNPDRARSWFTQWLFGSNQNSTKSKVAFLWYPQTDKGPKIKIITNDKSHNLVSIRSKTKESLIVVSSASNPLTTESWTFSINFNLETMIATRVQSNHAGVRGEVLSYQCDFEDLEPGIFLENGVTPIG